MKQVNGYLAFEANSNAIYLLLELFIFVLTNVGVDGMVGEVNTKISVHLRVGRFIN
jgi:hypothetical protein